MAEESAPEGKVEAKPGGGFLSGTKGWIIVIAITLLQAGFWIAMMIVREPSDAPEPAEQAKAFLDDPAILQSKVEFKGFSVTIPGPGGDLRPLSFDMVLELHYLPEERRPGAARPTPPQIEAFRTVVVQLESKLRDHMNSFLAGQSFNNLVGERGPELVKAEVMRFVNNELEKYDFEKLKIPANISRRRVTNVLLPSWTLM